MSVQLKHFEWHHADLARSIIISGFDLKPDFTTMPPAGLTGTVRDMGGVEVRKSATGGALLVIEGEASAECWIVDDYDEAVRIAQDVYALTEPKVHVMSDESTLRVRTGLDMTRTLLSLPGVELAGAR